MAGVKGMKGAGLGGARPGSGRKKSNPLPPVSGAYLVKCKENGRSYVGSSIKIDSRINAHFSAARAGRHFSKLFNEDYALYGAGGFEVTVLEECAPDKNLLKDLETKYLKQLDPVYNKNRKGGAGGAREGAGRKKQIKPTKGEIVVHQTKEEILAEYEKRLASAQHRLVAEAMTRLDTDMNNIKLLMEMGLMPPAFTQAVKSAELAHQQLTLAKQNLDLLPMDKVKQLGRTVALIEQVS